jgi:hypothetical protein
MSFKNYKSNRLLTFKSIEDFNITLTFNFYNSSYDETKEIKIPKLILWILNKSPNNICSIEYKIDNIEMKRYFKVKSLETLLIGFDLTDKNSYDDLVDLYPKDISFIFE